MPSRDVQYLDVPPSDTPRWQEEEEETVADSVAIHTTIKQITGRGGLIEGDGRHDDGDGDGATDDNDDDDGDDEGDDATDKDDDDDDDDDDSDGAAISTRL